jgi:hypothetical protein
MMLKEGPPTRSRKTDKLTANTTECCTYMDELSFLPCAIELLARVIDPLLIKCTMQVGAQKLNDTRKEGTARRSIKSGTWEIDEIYSGRNRRIQ